MIWRVDVTHCPNRNDRDAQADAIESQLSQFLGRPSGHVASRRIFLIDSDSPRPDIQRAARSLLADPIVEHADIHEIAPSHYAPSLLEIHLKPGVMDPVAASTEQALLGIGLSVRAVRTGRAFTFSQTIEPQLLTDFARKFLYNPVIEQAHLTPLLPTSFAVARQAAFDLRHIPLRNLDDDALLKLSRDGHLFLNLTEMQAVQNYFKHLNREPTDIELETLAQTWSEHCVHKTLKSAVDVVDESGQHLRHYKNLIKETIFASTQSLIASRNDGFCLSVFKDNAGVIAFDDTDAVCFKVETHNRPSAIEPYGGAATGIGGCIRDVLGTGLGARPIANTDTFCVGLPETSSLPPGVIAPRRVLQQVMAGVRDYGNRMGIPTVNGAVHFHPDYIANPLVFAGCVGIIPRSKVAKQAQHGDAIVVIGGRTGRDGIHGATFSSAELTNTHADEFSHAVQIGNAITQKQMMDVLLNARDAGPNDSSLYSAVTDCGAGGLSSAIGEMGADLGAIVDLDLVPLKYSGLRYDEIWISEAQERMVLAVPQQNVHALLQLCQSESVEATVIGSFGNPDRELILRYHNTEVGRMSMDFVHDGIPMPTRKAIVPSNPPPSTSTTAPLPTLTRENLLATLADPNVASKHWIIRQYDHEVQGTSVIKPLVGPQQIGPSDAAVIRPKLHSSRAVVVACGIQPNISDPYHMAVASIDEAVRNAICVGADLNQLAILDNFCWPGVHDERSMGTLVRACEACRDVALAWNIPFISGKDSLHNQFTDATTGRVIRIPPTLLISAIGIIHDLSSCITSPFKKPGSTLLYIRTQADKPSLNEQLASHKLVAGLIANGITLAAHDVSDGGWATTLAEMAIGSSLGASIDPGPLASRDHPLLPRISSYILEIETPRVPELPSIIARLDPSHLVASEILGCVTREDHIHFKLTSQSLHISLDDLRQAWRGTLDW